MARAGANKHMHKAKKGKYDEFYTIRSDVENELRQNVNILPILRPRRSQPDGKFQALLDLLRTSTHKANQSIIESAVREHDDTSEVIVHQKN